MVLYSLQDNLIFFLFFCVTCYISFQNCVPFSSNSVLKKGPEISTLMQNDFKKFTANAVKRV